MKQLYNKAIYDYSTPIKSYWEEVVEEVNRAY